MENTRHRSFPFVVFSVIFLGATAFSCSLAAEFKKSKTKDMKLDGSLCYVPRSAAYGLGVAALVCLSTAQIAGTTVAAANLRAKGTNESRRSRCISITLLVLSWISFGLAAILLGTGSSMNDKQPYGKGWMNGECYFVKDGVYIGSAVLAATTVIFIIGFTFTTTTTERIHRRTIPDEKRNQRNEQGQER